MVYVSRIKGLKLSKMLLELFCFNLFEYKNHAMYFRNMENTKVEILKSLEKLVNYFCNDTEKTALFYGIVRDFLTLVSNPQPSTEEIPLQPSTEEIPLSKRIDELIKTKQRKIDQIERNEQNKRDELTWLPLHEITGLKKYSEFNTGQYIFFIRHGDTTIKSSFKFLIGDPENSTLRVCFGDSRRNQFPVTKITNQSVSVLWNEITSDFSNCSFLTSLAAIHENNMILKLFIPPTKKTITFHVQKQNGTGTWDSIFTSAATYNFFNMKLRDISDICNGRLRYMSFEINIKSDYGEKKCTLFYIDNNPGFSSFKICFGGHRELEFPVTAIDDESGITWNDKTSFFDLKIKNVMPITFDAEFDRDSMKLRSSMYDCDFVFDVKKNMDEKNWDEILQN